MFCKFESSLEDVREEALLFEVPGFRACKGVVLPVVVEAFLVFIMVNFSLDVGSIESLDLIS